MTELSGTSEDHGHNGDISHQDLDDKASTLPINFGGISPSGSSSENVPDKLC